MPDTDTHDTAPTGMPADGRKEIVRLTELLNQSRSDRKADRIAAEERERLLNSLTQVVPVGVVFADTKGRITHGNKATERLVGHPVIHSPDVNSYGQWVSYHADGTRVQSHEYPLAKVILDGAQHSELDVHYERPDGTKFWMRIIGEPVLDDDGALTGATVVLIDIDREVQLKSVQEILIAELNHRVKNAFSVTQSIVSRSLKNQEIAPDLIERIDRRLNAYAKAHATLIGTTWGYADMAVLARQILEPIAGDRVTVEGPDLEMPSRTAIAFSMAFYELATNAVKYGSLSEEGGTILVTWSVDRTVPDEPTVKLSWLERGGPPATQPTNSGFGSFITGRAIMAETKGTAETLYMPRGLEWHLEMSKPEESGS